MAGKSRQSLIYKKGGFAETRPHMRKLYYGDSFSRLLQQPHLHH